MHVNIYVRVGLFCFPSGCWKHFVRLLMRHVSTLFPPVQESFLLFIISFDSSGSDGEAEKAFCQFASV